MPNFARGLSLTFLAVTVLRGEPLFEHRTFADFSRGTVSDSGANLYVSRAGRLQYVNLFDLNGDGHPELAINNDHNTHAAPDVLVYRNRKPGGLRSLTRPMAQDTAGYENLLWTVQSLAGVTRLPSQGGGKAVLADLDGDGYQELLFTNFIHGSTQAVLPVYLYWGGSDGFDPTRRSTFSADRGTGLAVADVTGDGLKDIIVSNAGREHLVSLAAARLPHDELAAIGGPREKTSYVFRQTESGFTPEAVEVIPTLFAIDVKAADLDRSGQPALIFLETGKPGALRILRRQHGGWGDPQLLPVLAPGWRKSPPEILVKDLNGDGYPDIFVPSQGPNSEIFWNDRGRFSASNRTVLAVSDVGGADAGDLNGDGHIDLVTGSHVARPAPRARETLGTSYIWWGGEAGFHPDRRTGLPTLDVVAVRVADVNHTGRLDILFAQHRDGESFDISSTIYLNSEKGFSPDNRLDLQGYGANAMLAGDLDGDGRMEVVLTNGESGHARHDGAVEVPGAADDDVNGLPLYIFRGNEAGQFGPANAIRLPEASSEAGLAFADLDDDGRTALIYLRRNGTRLVIRHDVYRYPQSHETTAIDLPFGAMTVNVADFNRDGILDLLVTPMVGKTGAVLFGQGDRKYRLQAFAIGLPAYHCAVGDIDHDGVLDAVTGGTEGISILRGVANDGFTFAPPVVLPSEFFTPRVSLADFDDDGDLDILCQNLQNFVTKSYEVQSWVLINDKGRFSLDRKRTFSTFGANGGSIARFRPQDKLQVVAGNYQGNISRRVGALILAADRDGFPVDENKQRLPAASSSANLVLDFNSDGHQDIAVFNHMGSDVHNGDLAPAGGAHGIGSTIYWGGEEGFRADRSSWVPSFGPHSRIAADPGSLLRREPFETYTSELLVNRTTHENFLLTITGRFNRKQFVTPEILPGSPDTPGSGVPATLLSGSDSSMTYRVSVPPGARFRYRLTLHSSYTGAGPVIAAVKMEAGDRR